MRAKPTFRYNTCIESYHSVLKKELIYADKLRSYEELQQLLFEYTEGFYNTRRTQKRLGYLSPKEYFKKYLNRQDKCVPIIDTSPRHRLSEIYLNIILLLKV